MNDLISRQTVINEINERQRKLIYCFGFENDMVKIMDIAKSIVIAIPSAQPEYIQNNAVHLCDSCQYTYATCLSHGNDAVFGDGKGNDNICACNKYRPISAQPEQKTGHWKHINEEEERAKHNGQLLGWMPWYCSECGCGVGKHQTPFCPNCGADMRGEKDV